MAIKLTISNMLQLLSLIAPVLLCFFLVMSSLFNQNIKGVIYLAGVLMASVINLFLMNQLQSPKLEDAAFNCNLLELPYMTEFNSPSSSSLFIAFTVAYLVLPMFYNNQMNYILLGSLLCLFGLDTVTQVTNKCTTMAGSIFGALLGFLLGAVWYSIFKAAGYESLLYFDELVSNNVSCSRPSTQTFRCKVFKNGELISSQTV